jgi:hypothetical protein
MQSKSEQGMVVSAASTVCLTTAADEMATRIPVPCGVIDAVWHGTRLTKHLAAAAAAAAADE